MTLRQMVQVSDAKPSPTRPSNDPARRRWITKLVLYAILTIIALIMVYPLLWLVSSSFKGSQEIFTNTSLIPQTTTLSNYVDGWNATPDTFGRYMLNSLLVCLGCAIGNVLSCSLAAYAFARIRFRFSKLWFALMLGSVMLPSQVLLIPQYFIFHGLGWVGTYLPLIIPKFLATDAFFVFLMVQFMRGLPAELDEAAELDGCNRFQTFVRIVMPLSVPAIVTTIVFTFIWTYEDFLGPLIYLSDPSTYTAAQALATFTQGTGQSSYGQLFAMSAVSLVPVLVFFLLFQRKLLEGIATTGLKG